MMVVMVLSKRMRCGDYCDGDDGDEIEQKETEKWC